VPTALAAAKLANVAAGSSNSGGSGGADDAYAKLRGKLVLRSSDGAQLDLPSVIGANKAVVAWGRSFG
jgi:hypothetical protein